MVDINVTLKFLGVGYKDKYQANIKIYDSNNCLVFDGVSYNGKVCVNLCPNCSYKVIAFFLGKYVSLSIYVGKQDYFIINLCSCYERTVTFWLLDYYYNLPIMKGEIILGKDN